MTSIRSKPAKAVTRPDVQGAYRGNSSALAGFEHIHKELTSRDLTERRRASNPARARESAHQGRWPRCFGSAARAKCERTL